MSLLSVNDHLEGILSDFEALKRSFEIEDVDDIQSFSPASPISNPISPSSSPFFLSHSKASDGRGGGGLSPSKAFNNNTNLGSSAHRSCISRNRNPSPDFKTHTVVSSLSFNRGTTDKLATKTNGTSVSRAASFQNRLHPNGYSLVSGPGSDSDSLHSSTSSLEYSGGFVGAPHFTKLVSYSSPSSQGEFYRIQPQIPQHRIDESINLEGTTGLKKFSSHGSVFHSEMDQGPGRLKRIPEPNVVSHGSMPSLEQQICDGGGGIVSRGGGRMYPGLQYTSTDANWSAHFQNATSLGVKGYNDSVNHLQQQGSHLIKSPEPKAKEIPCLNKFPLDLDSLVSSSSSTSPTKPQQRPVSPNFPKPAPKSTGSLCHHTNQPSSPLASPAASLSSLDSYSETLPFPLYHPYLPVSPHSPSPLQGSIPVPQMREEFPLSQYSSQSSQLGILSEIQVGQLPATSPFRPSSTKIIQPLEVAAGEANDSVGLILQRIASFSQSVITDTTHVAVTQPPIVQCKGHLSSAHWCLTETTSMPMKKQGNIKQEETPRVLETDTLAPMEDREEKESGVMGNEEEAEGNREGHVAIMNTQDSLKDKEVNSVEVHTEMEKGMEKGMEEGEMKKEVEAEVKVELCQSVPDLQLSIIRGTDLFGYVGIEAVLEQMKHKTMKAGFEFNIMVVGQSGLGKSTLVNTLFKSKVSRKSCTPSYEEKISKTVQLHSVCHVIEEKGVKMKLTVVDTPGFGDQINNENCWEPIVKYVNEQYEKYLREELLVNRKKRIPDTRVHGCIYFLPPTGHRLRPIDVEFMKRLGKIVSIVPVIAKADTLTIEERLEFKEGIRQDLAASGICVYPQKEYDEDPEVYILNERIRETIPFAVVGTDKEHQVNGNKVLGRKTKWGIIEVENVAHCEFANLRDLLIRSHLQDLKDVTHNIHYESYRVQRLNESNMNFSELSFSAWPQENGSADKSGLESHL